SRDRAARAGRRACRLRLPAAAAVKLSLTNREHDSRSRTGLLLPSWPANWGRSPMAALFVWALASLPGVCDVFPLANREEYGMTKPANGKTAIVTGAGTGIGKAAATALLAEGWNTVFVGRRKNVLDEAVAEAQTSSSGAKA